MKRVLSFARLFRVPNLLIVAATMLIYAFGLLYPALNEAEVTPVLWLKDLYLLVFITVSIAAFGYLHNDLEDRDSDRINERPIYGILSRTARVLLLLFFALAPAPFALSLALEIEQPSYFGLYFVAVGLIFLYNTYLKKWPVIGNMAIAALCAGVIGILILGEWTALELLKERKPDSYNAVIYIGIAFMIFAFVITLLRELIKDVEDIKGDQATGQKTFPVRFGIGASKKLAMFYWLILSTFIVITGRSYILETGYYWWLLLLVILPACILPFILLNARENEDFKHLSLFLKYYMVSGLLFLIHLKSVIQYA